MTLLFRQFYNLVYLLNSETATKSIAAGVACGVILGFSPVLSLQALLVFLVVLVFRIQFGAVLLSMAFFKLLSPFFVSLFHRVGEAALSVGFLEPVYTALYNLPLVPYTRFYNTVVMGGGLVSLALVLPVYWVSQQLIDRYRETVLKRLKESRLWKIWKTTSLYKWYQKYESLMGN